MYQQADMATKMFLYEAFQLNYLQSIITPLVLMRKTDQLARLFARPRVTPRDILNRSDVVDSFEAHFARLDAIFEGDLLPKSTCRGCLL